MTNGNVAIYYTVLRLRPDSFLSANPWILAWLSHVTE